MAVSEAFETAAADVKKLTKPLENEQLLELYALFKIAHNDDITKAPKPGMFDLKNKAKQRKWQEELDKSTTPEDAEKKYIETVNKYKETHGYDAGKEPEAVGS